MKVKEIVGAEEDHKAEECKKAEKVFGVEEIEGEVVEDEDEVLEVSDSKKGRG